MTDDREKDFPQRFIRVVIPCIVEWTNEGPRSHPDIQANFAQVVDMADSDLVQAALENLDCQIDQLDPSAATIIRGAYVLHDGHVMTSIKLARKNP